MKKTLILMTAIVVVWAGVAAAETVILDEDFGSWPAGTIDGSYTLPGGWSMLASGMSVGTENAQTGKTVKCSNGSAGTIRFQWTPVDPTTANPLKIVIYERLGTQAKVEKGAVLLNASTLGGACDPAVYLYENTADSTQYRVRDRANCLTPSAPAVYGTSATTFNFVKSTLETWVKWEIVCDDTGAELFKDDVSQGTFAGAPNGLLDNFEAIDIGVPQTNWWGSEYSTNGDIWFDRIQVIQGPFGPPPTPTPEPGSVNLPFYEDFESYTTLSDVRKTWILDTTTTWNLSSTQHTTGGSKSLQDQTDSKVEQNAEVAWDPVQPLDNFPIEVRFWWRFDAQGGANDKLDKFVQLTNDGGGAPGTSAITFGAFWFSQVAPPNGGGLVDGSPTSYANLDGISSSGSNCTTDQVWWEWVFQGYPDRCEITADGSDFLACCGFGAGSGAPNADVAANPWNRLRFGAFYGTSYGRGWFFLDDITVKGPPSTGIEERDWASY